MHYCDVQPSFAGSLTPTSAYVLRSLLPTALRAIVCPQPEPLCALAMVVLSIIHLNGGAVSEGARCLLFWVRTCRNRCARGAAGVHALCAAASGRLAPLISSTCQGVKILPFWCAAAELRRELAVSSYPCVCCNSTHLLHCSSFTTPPHYHLRICGRGAVAVAGHTPHACAATSTHLLHRLPEAIVPAVTRALR